MPRDSYVLEDHRPPPPPDDPDAAPEQRRTGARLLAGMLLAALVFVVYELTASPMAAAIAGGLKFGWDDLAIGWWLWRRDPQRFRGVLLLLVQASRGAYVASLVACGVAAAADLLLAMLGAGRGPQPLPLAHLIRFALAAAAACVTLTVVWIVLAAASGTQVWAGGGLAGCKRRDEWPPRPRGRNTAAAMIGATAYFLVAGAAAAWLISRRGRVPFRLDIGTISLIAIGLGIAAAFVGGRLGRRLTGRWAEAVWPDAQRSADAARTAS